MSEDEILAVIKRYPEAIIESLSKKPELLISFILKLAPWDRFATKEDIKMLIELFNKRFEEFKAYSDKRFEDLMAYSDKRFEELKSYSDKRFEDINRRFEAIDKRFEDMNKRFEDMNKRFEDLKYYVDRRFDEVNRRLTSVERIMLAFNIPILIAILTMLIKTFIG